MCTSRECKSFMALISQVMVKKAAGPLHISDTFRKMLLESERTADEDPWLADLETVSYVLENACCLRKLWLFLFRRLHTAVHLSWHVQGQAKSITLLFLLPQGEGFRENSHGTFIMKGLVKLILALFPNTRTTSPHRDMHVAIFIYSCVSFHIFKMLLTYDLYVWFSSCPSFLHADWALDISCLPHDSHCAFFAACPYLCVRACTCVHHPRCASAVNQTKAMLPSTRIWVMNINYSLRFLK